MRIAAVLLFLFCLASGCSDKDGIPSGIIPREEMGKILWDMVEADQYSSIYLAKDSALLTGPVTVGPAVTAGKYPVPAAAKNLTHVSAKDSIGIRHRRDSVRAIEVKDSLRLSHRKDSFRLSLKMKDLGLYQQVFQLHHVNPDDFRKSFQFYLDHPDIAKTLIDSVLARGNRLRMESYTTPPGASGVAPSVPGVPPAHPGLPPNFQHRPVTASGVKGKPTDVKGKAPGLIKP
jgi:hypothetical protein